MKDKKMWGFIIDISTKLIDAKIKKYEDLLEAWDNDNSKIITWMNNFVVHSIRCQLVKYANTKDVL